MLDEQQLGDYIDQHFTSTLFRLETLDNYDVSSSSEDLQNYLAGRPGPLNKEPWLNVIRGEVARSLHTYRVHVLRSPLTDYLRYECEWGYAYNASAGEHIRIIDTVEQEKPDAVPHEDFWLIGDEHVLLVHYDVAGSYEGATVEEPEQLPRYIAAREAAWSTAIDFTDYWRRHPEYHRDRSVA